MSLLRNLSVEQNSMLIYFIGKSLTCYHLFVLYNTILIKSILITINVIVISKINYFVIHGIDIQNTLNYQLNSKHQFSKIKFNKPRHKLLVNNLLR